MLKLQQALLLKKNLENLYMDNTEQTFKKLLDSGAIEISGITESGEPLYIFTDKLKSIAPDLYGMHVNFVNAQIMRLWEKGFIDMDLLEENPKVKISKKAFNQEEVANLSHDDRWSLQEIKRILNQ